MTVMHKIGTKIEPCGAPKRVVKYSVNVFLTLILFLLVISYQNYQILKGSKIKIEIVASAKL